LIVAEELWKVNSMDTSLSLQQDKKQKMKDLEAS
jgi:hypothetical protein